MFESPQQLILGLITGIAFGFLLQKGQVAKYQTILGQLLLKDWTVAKVMLTAIVVGAVGVHSLVALGAAHLDIWPFQIAAALAGAVFFGVGFAVIGYCPGTGMAASGEGSRDAMIGVLGMITGAGIYVAAYDWIEPIALALDDLGKVTIAELMGVPPWTVIVALAAVVVVALGLLELHERGRRGSSRHETERRASWPEWTGQGRGAAGS